MSVPVLYKEKENCCGCGACKDACPQNAIEMTADFKGFFYPEIDEEKCVECELCLKVCPLK